MMSRISKPYCAYALAVLIVYAAACFRGWSFTSVDEVKDVPRTVRENPGSYRSHYVGTHHYTGGK
jgi:hypothetical protein